MTAVSLKNISEQKHYDFRSMEATTQLLHLPEYAQHPLILIHLANIN